jgi:hypothetical protein
LSKDAEVLTEEHQAVNVKLAGDYVVVYLLDQRVNMRSETSISLASIACEEISKLFGSICNIRPLDRGIRDDIGELLIRAEVGLNVIQTRAETQAVSWRRNLFAILTLTQCLEKWRRSPGSTLRELEQCLSRIGREQLGGQEVRKSSGRKRGCSIRIGGRRP